MNDTLRTILCFSLIGVILVGYYYWNMPSAEQIEEQQRQAELARQAQQAEIKKAEERKDSIPIFAAQDSDSLKAAKATQRFAEFAQGAYGENKTVTLQNDLISVEISTKGATVNKVTLKNYNNFKKEPVVLFDSTSNHFSAELVTNSFRRVPSDILNFQIEAQTDSSVILSVPVENGGKLKFSYILPANSYMVGFNINMSGLDEILNLKDGLKTNWRLSVQQQEKGRKFENRYAQIYYNTKEDGDIDYLSETSNDQEELSESLRWIAFKDQYFSSILIADDRINDVKLQSALASDSSEFLKHYEANFSLPVSAEKSVDMRYFFGPNKYNLLKSYDKGVSSDQKLQLKRIVPLGWFVFRWVNQIFTIPLFNWLGGFNLNYGIIILIMTIILKLIISPLTYKSYLSTAKMKVLKPQIDEINARIPAENSVERSQATMELYTKAGVNPMGGCLPMLLQMPFLVAFFYFFPNAIELRGQSFLWAEDLSTYDAILTWGKDIWPIGDHLSLFCLLMSVTNAIYTYFNMSMTDSSNQMGQFPMMKYMMYFMPVMFLFIFNDYASGLSYYYFISVLITIIQTIVIRKFAVDEDKLLLKIQENQKRPQKRGGGSWLNSIAEMQKRQMEMMQEQQKMQKKQ